MKVRSIDKEFAVVEASGLLRWVNIQMLSGLKVGEYVMVHAGFAMERLNPKKAKETLKIIHEIH